MCRQASALVGLMRIHRPAQPWLANAYDAISADDISNVMISV